MTKGLLSSAEVPTQSSERYGVLTRAIHWILALALIAMIGFGLYLDSLSFSKEKVALIQLHKSFGVGIAFLLCVRVVNRVREGFLPIYGSPTQQIAARAVHIVLLLLPLGLVASGFLRSLAYGKPIKFFGMEIVPVVMEKNDALHAIASNAHAAMAWVLVGGVLLHLTATIWHHFVLRDSTLSRVLPVRTHQPGQRKKSAACQG